MSFFVDKQALIPKEINGLRMLILQPMSLFPASRRMFGSSRYQVTWLKRMLRESL